MSSGKPPRASVVEMETLKARDTWQRLVLADQRLPNGCKLTLLSLSLFRNLTTSQCNPRYQTLADSTGMKLSAIAQHLKLGEDLGYLRRTSSKGRHSNSYDLLMPNDTPTTHRDGELTAHPRVGLTTHENGGLESNHPPACRPTTHESSFEPPTATDAEQRTILNRERNKEGNTSLFPSLPVIAPEVSPAFFERFYEAYPRKRAKGDAETALKQVLKKKLATEQELMEGVARLADHFGRRPRADRAYIPYPASWLRKQGWKDEYDEPARAASGASRVHDDVDELQRWARQ